MRKLSKQYQKYRHEQKRDLKQDLKRKDRHHILYQRAFWQYGWAKKLRDHKYLQVKISQYGLHQKIHDQIHDIPRPNGRMCKRTYREMERRLANGMLDMSRDTMQDRLEFLMEMWDGFSPGVVMLRWTWEIVQDYADEHGVLVGVNQLLAPESETA